MNWRRLRELILDPRARLERRELKRLSALPRHQEAVTMLPGAPFHVVDGRSFVDQYAGLWKRNMLSFRTSAPRPLVIDGGANVGLTVAYWKKIHPTCRVIAFEADPRIHRIAVENVASLGLTDVDVRHAALWSTDGEVRFSSEGSDSGRLSELGEVGESCTVPAVALPSLLDEPVQMLKLDIEGAEGTVLEACRGRLGNVERMYIEYHSFERRPQELGGILSLLEASGFRIHVREGFATADPFLGRRTHLGMDNLLDIFAWRDEA